MTNLEKAIEWIFRAEGGYSDHENDAGGATRYGVSLRFLKLNKIDINDDGEINHQDITDIDKQAATEIYREHFWEKANCDMLPNAVAIAVFDEAVNAGVGTAVRHLQNVVNVSPDGLIGPVTLDAVKRMSQDYLLVCYLSRRVRYYHHIVEHHPNYKDFLNGWLNRLFSLQQYLYNRRSVS